MVQDTRNSRTRAYYFSLTQRTLATITRGIRQEIEEGSIEMPHLPTGEMLSNHAPNVPAKEINY